MLYIYAQYFFSSGVCPLCDMWLCWCSAGSKLSEVRMVEESQSMKDACKIMLEPLTKTGRIRTGFGTSLLEEARAAGRGDGAWACVCWLIYRVSTCLVGTAVDKTRERERERTQRLSINQLLVAESTTCSIARCVF